MDVIGVFKHTHSIIEYIGIKLMIRQVFLYSCENSVFSDISRTVNRVVTRLYCHLLNVLLVFIISIIIIIINCSEVANSQGQMEQQNPA